MHIYMYRYKYVYIFFLLNVLLLDILARLLVQNYFDFFFLCYNDSGTENKLLEPSLQKMDCVERGCLVQCLSH